MLPLLLLHVLTKHYSYVLLTFFNTLMFHAEPLLCEHTSPQRRQLQSKVSPDSLVTMHVLDVGSPSWT